jgi:hypothetical protein
MPYSGGVYTNPGWANDQSPYINKQNLDDISNALADLTANASVTTPITKGGTGATTAAQARANLGVPESSTFVSKGSNENPVYFDANGAAVPISVLNTSYTDSGGAYSYNIYKYGHVVTLYLRASIQNIGGGRKEVSYTNLIPSGYRPSLQTYGVAAGYTSASVTGDADTTALVSINTSGTVRFSEIGSNFGSAVSTRHFHATITYVIA